MPDSTSALAEQTAPAATQDEQGAFLNPGACLRCLSIPIGATIADFGSGSGAYSLEAAKIVGPNGKIYAVDVQKDMLSRLLNEATRRGYKNVNVIWGDFENVGGTKIADASADMVIISNVLYQLDNKPGALGEAHRILKPDGVLMLIDWSDSFGGMGPKKDAVLPKQTAFQLLAAAGYTVMSEIPAGTHHYGILAQPIAKV